jgi:hypothetical protein
MSRLTADLEPLDHQRAGRAILAWLTGDQVALNTALDEADDEPRGLPGLLFALLETTCGFALALTGGDRNAAIEQIRRSLLALAQRDNNGTNGEHGE